MRQHLPDANGEFPDSVYSASLLFPHRAVPLLLVNTLLLIDTEQPRRRGNPPSTAASRLRRKAGSSLSPHPAGRGGARAGGGSGRERGGRGRWQRPRRRSPAASGGCARGQRAAARRPAGGWGTGATCLPAGGSGGEAGERSDLARIFSPLVSVTPRRVKFNKFYVSLGCVMCRAGSRGLRSAAPAADREAASPHGEVGSAGARRGRGSAPGGCQRGFTGQGFGAPRRRASPHTEPLCRRCTG